MWVYCNDAMVSAVAHREKDNVLMVRGRFSGDVERFLGWDEGDQRVSRTPEADYLYRTEVEMPFFLERLLMKGQEINYPNFKNSIPEGTLGDIRHDAYMSAWSGMIREQRSLEPKTGYMGFGKYG